MSNPDGWKELAKQTYRMSEEVNKRFEKWLEIYEQLREVEENEGHASSSRAAKGKKEKEKEEEAEESDIEDEECEDSVGDLFHQHTHIRENLDSAWDNPLLAFRGLIHENSPPYKLKELQLQDLVRLILRVATDNAAGRVRAVFEMATIAIERNMFSSVPVHNILLAIKCPLDDLQNTNAKAEILHRLKPKGADEATVREIYRTFCAAVVKEYNALNLVKLQPSTVVTIPIRSKQKNQ